MHIQQRQLAQEFDELVETYHVLLKFHEGRGKNGQTLIDHAHQKLTAFGDLHPEWKDKVPMKVNVYDDGCNGLQSAIQDLWRRRFLDGGR